MSYGRHCNRLSLANAVRLLRGYSSPKSKPAVVEQLVDGLDELMLDQVGQVTARGEEDVGHALARLNDASMAASFGQDSTFTVTFRAAET